jgi:hypothetical protein
MRTSIILFLNKVDIFKVKLPRSPLGNYFPDYSGGNDVNKAAKYLLWRFNQVNRAHLNLYPQYVDPSVGILAGKKLTCDQFNASDRYVEYPTSLCRSEGDHLEQCIKGFRHPVITHLSLIFLLTSWLGSNYWGVFEWVPRAAMMPRWAPFLCRHRAIFAISLLCYFIFFWQGVPDSADTNDLYTTFLRLEAEGFRSWEVSLAIGRHNDTRGIGSRTQRRYDALEKRKKTREPTVRAKLVES